MLQNITWLSSTGHPGADEDLHAEDARGIIVKKRKQVVGDMRSSTSRPPPGGKAP